MKVLLDMPVTSRLRDVLEAGGHEGVHAAALGKQRASDRDCSEPPAARSASSSRQTRISPACWR